MGGVDFDMGLIHPARRVPSEVGVRIEKVEHRFRAPINCADCSGIENQPSSRLQRDAQNRGKESFDGTHVAHHYERGSGEFPGRFIRKADDARLNALKRFPSRGGARRIRFPLLQ